MKKICCAIIVLVAVTFPAYGAEMKIKMTFNNEKVVIRLFGNPVSQNFFSRLPMTLKFQDYMNIEKVAYLPQKISTQGISNGDNKDNEDKGDFTYFAPWGNIAIFYNGNGGNDVIHLGTIESGKEKLAIQPTDFSAVIERIK